MIFYTQSLSKIEHNVAEQAAHPPADLGEPQRQFGAAVEAPLVLTGIPFDQPDPGTSQTLRQMALHLEGIHQVSFGR